MGSEDNGQDMQEGEEVFPMYRSSVDGRHYYRIEAKDMFTEIQVVGNRHLVHHVTARAYPELVRIMEMISLHEGRYKLIEEDTWSEELKRTDRKV